jgi:type I restriction enzyme R subunit
VFIDKVIDRMDQNQAFFTRVLDDEHFKKALMEYMLVETYEKLNSMV